MRFFSLLLETIRYWSKESRDSKFKRPNQFKHLFMILQSEGVVFPTDSPNLHLFRIEVPEHHQLLDSQVELPMNIESSLDRFASNLNKPPDGKYSIVGTICSSRLKDKGAS